MRRASKSLSWAIMLKLLWGCSHTLVHEDGLTYGERQTQLQTINDWKMNGRIVVETDAQAFQGRFQWQQSGNLMDLSIRGPFGANVLRVEGSPKKLIVYERSEFNLYNLSINLIININSKF